MQKNEPRFRVKSPQPLGRDAAASKFFRYRDFSSEGQARAAAVMGCLVNRKPKPGVPLTLDPHTLNRLWRSLEGAGWRVEPV